MRKRVVIGLVARHGKGSHLGVPCGLDLKFQSLVIESFSLPGDSRLASSSDSVLALSSGALRYLFSFAKSVDLCLAPL